MDWKSILHKGILRGGICFLLSAAIILGLVLPGTNMKPAQPTDPLENESIREISVLKVGENINELQTIVVPNGGSAAPTEPKEESEETDPEESQPNETVPQETQTDEQDVDEGEEGNEDDQQGEEGGEELNLDLAAVLTWYRYGNEPKTITCGPSKAVAKTLNTAQLKNSELKYRFDLTGVDARYVEIISVSLAEGDSAYREVSESGSVEIQLPGGNGDRKYTFQVTALAEKENDEGETVQQEIQFFFVLKCEFTMDLEMELIWKEKEGKDHTITCGPDKAEAFTVQNYELNERIFNYTTNLKGTLADNAEIVEASYTTASGIHSGTLEKDGGSLILDPEPGKDTETYYLTFTVKTDDRTVLYTYNLVYQEMLEVELSFTWREKGMIDHVMTCKPGGMTSERIKNNQLSGGAIPFEMELVGADAQKDGIKSVSYTSDTGSGPLNPSDFLPMTMSPGETSNTYRITVNALVSGQRMTFEVVLYYANDVTLQMEYSVQENGSTVQRLVACENTKTRTAEDIYDDQLTNGLLEYRMSVVGSDAETVSITSVTCFQSGSGRTVTLSESGEIELMLNNGKTGKNTFTIQAQDDGGNTYHFTINIPYKHRGENNIKIETNLVDGQEVVNGAKTNLLVKAWSEDASGNVLDYIPANGVDTKLIVKLDDVELSYISSSGASSEYDLVPENPEVGDTNEHILYVYAEDAFGNFGELTLTLMGQRRESGQKIGTATIYVDMTVLGLGVVDSLKYEVLADEPVSYVIAKALLGEDTGDPFGAASETFGWTGRYEGTLDIGFYLASLTTGHSAKALEGSSWPGSTEAEVLEAIDNQFGAGTGLATLWRCIYRNGLNKSSGSGGSFGEFDYTSGSGWMYSIGGTTYYPGQSMSAVYLQDGDSLIVRFTLAQGWDVGGGAPGYGSTVGYCVSAVNGSFHISHQMETVTGANGAEINMCHCCGIIQDCVHQNMTYMDLEDGTHIQYCDDCKTAIGDPAEHTWNQDSSADVHTCTVCSATEAHIWKEIAGSNTATCTEAGTRSVRCVTCEATKEEASAPKGHTFDNEWYYTKTEHYQKCSTCETEHSHGAHQYVYDSEWEDNSCTICGVLHDFDAECSGSQTVDESASTCREIRYTCGGCGNTLTMVGEFDEYHAYENGLCKHCGEEDPDYDPDNADPDTHVHNWGEWYVTIEPTEEEEGEEARDCDCGETQTRTIEKLGHTHNFEVVDEVESTCEEAGYRYSECECGESKTEEFPLAEHDYEVVDEEASTCTKNGYRDYECTVCYATRYESLPLADHVWGEDGICVNCSEVQPQSLFYTDNLSDNRKRRNYL